MFNFISSESPAGSQVVKMQLGASENTNRHSSKLAVGLASVERERKVLLRPENWVFAPVLGGCGTVARLNCPNEVWEAKIIFIISILNNNNNIIIIYIIIIIYYAWQ